VETPAPAELQRSPGQGTYDGGMSDPPPDDTDEVMIWNRLSGKSVGFTLPEQYDDLIEYLQRTYDRRTSPADFARAQGWETDRKPSQWRLLLAKLWR
jgi:hypothetical protein